MEWLFLLPTLRCLSFSDLLTYSCRLHFSTKTGFFSQDDQLANGYYLSWIICVEVRLSKQYLLPSPCILLLWMLFPLPNLIGNSWYRVGHDVSSQRGADQVTPSNVCGRTRPLFPYSSTLLELEHVHVRHTYMSTDRTGTIFRRAQILFARRLQRFRAQFSHDCLDFLSWLLLRLPHTKATVSHKLSLVP